MLRAFRDRYERFFGRGDASITVPPMDGPLLHNNRIDRLTTIATAPSPDNLVAADGGLFLSDGSRLLQLSPDGDLRERHVFAAPISAMAAGPDGMIAVATDPDGAIHLSSGDAAPVRIDTEAAMGCVTAMVFLDDQSLILCQGSSTNPASAWRRDLLERNASGSLWRLQLSGAATRLAGGLAFPSGVVAVDGGFVISEAWRHRLIRIGTDGAGATPLLESLPCYPSRLVKSKEGGSWLCTFAGRGQLIEFVLSEHAYRTRMIEEVPEEYWIAPSFHSGQSFLEPIRGGTVKRMGTMKAWAPSASYGLVIELDDDFRPVSSLQSRSDGRRHGIMSCAEWAGSLYLASRGSGELLLRESGASE